MQAGAQILSEFYSIAVIQGANFTSKLGNRFDEMKFRRDSFLGPLKNSFAKTWSAFMYGRKPMESKTLFSST